MRAVMVSVNYTDILSVTLPYNRKHFEEVWIVTSCADYENVAPVAAANDARVVRTDVFYAKGASFNKWAALEQGLDCMGRHGWLCIMDADVLWPSWLTVGLYVDKRCVTFIEHGRQSIYSPGHLITPLRRMHENLSVPFLPEEYWGRYPLHKNVGEWAGYSQIFHASDPVLGPPPWHQTDWIHCGGADSFFQDKWGKANKVRPPWDCLHLGPAGKNWMGRATPYLDGTLPVNAAEKLAAAEAIWKNRAIARQQGKRGNDLFEGEKLS